MRCLLYFLPARAITCMNMHIHTCIQTYIHTYIHTYMMEDCETYMVCCHGMCVYVCACVCMYVSVYMIMCIADAYVVRAYSMCVSKQFLGARHQRFVKWAHDHCVHPT
jgi:hypothetical protein